MSATPDTASALERARRALAAETPGTERHARAAERVRNFERLEIAISRTMTPQIDRVLQGGLIWRSKHMTEPER